METARLTQGLQLLSLSQENHIDTQIHAFIIDRKAQRMSAGTLAFYRKKLGLFTRFVESQAITYIDQLTANDIREYLLWLESTGHNPGGVHCCYRALRTFLYWWEDEYEPEDWKNPIRKVKPPRIAVTPLEPADLVTVKAMLRTCTKTTIFAGARDRAALLFLLDTGCRAGEFTALDLPDYDTFSGAVTIRRGKGGKPRAVYVGRKTRKALRAYFRKRGADDSKALWVTDEHDRLHYGGVRSMVLRRAAAAGVHPPSLHSFRRFFALQCLRAGMDIFTLQKAMGHADLTVLRRYLAQTDDDVRLAHRQAAPVDRTEL